MVESRGGDSLNQEASWRPLSGGAQGGGKFKQRSFMETIVWWRAGRGSLNKRSFMETIVWWSAGGGEHLKKEASWRPLSGGAQGGGGSFYIKELHGDHCMVESRGGGTFK